MIHFLKKLLRLAQALSSKIYTGDIVMDSQAGGTSYVVGKIINDKRGNFYQGLFGKRKGLTHTGLICTAVKQKRRTIRKEWDNLWAPKPSQLAPLHQLCIDKNIGYLYDDLLTSKNAEQFKETMMLINRMLN